MPNVVLDDDYNTLDKSYKIAAMTDFVVARYTSLCDQCLANKIPVLIFEPLANGEPTIGAWHNYEPYPVLARTKDELFSRVSSIMCGDEFMPEFLFEKMQREYYGRDKDFISSEKMIITVIENEISRNI